MNPEGVSYQYEFERFTTDERTQNIRLSSSLNDFRSARIPGIFKTLTVALTLVSELPKSACSVTPWRSQKVGINKMDGIG